MTDYILDHQLSGERARLALMSDLLDPMHRRYLEEVGVGPGIGALEVGCGNGSISTWLGEQTAPGGRVVALDLDLSLVDADTRHVEFRQGDILAGPVEREAFDVVTARAVLHHIPDAQAALANLVASTRAGGAIVLIEPDFLPVSIAEPPEIRAFWAAWLSWSRRQGIDYMIGRRLPQMLAAVGLERIAATAETALYNGGSAWARYWQQTVIELRDRMIGSGELDARSIDAFVEHCADPSWWTQTIAFTAVRGYRPSIPAC
jgi:2-polyprenyl-3-methyl-5-hydroxy-6-metoxy-1,4-benzoquinol methylase